MNNLDLEIILLLLLSNSCYCIGECQHVFMSIGLDPDDYESEEKSDKSKSPSSIQSGKWQLGFQGDFKFFTVAAHLISFIGHWSTNK